MKDRRFGVVIGEILLRELEGEIFGELFDGKPRGGLIWLGCSFHLESEWLGRWIEPQENVSDF